MYPPPQSQSQYTRLPTAPDELPPPQQKYLHKTFSRSIHLRTYIRPRWILVAVVFLLSFVAFLSRDHLRNLKLFIFPSTAYSFSSTRRPTYLDITPSQPLILRIAIMSRRDEFERRQGLRNYVISGVPKTDVQFEHRFFVGAEKRRADAGAEKETVEAPMLVVSEKIEEEARMHGDMIVLSDIEDTPERLSEKRYSAVKWAGDVPSTSYDYFLTLDSDTFCRLGAFARHLPSLFASNGIIPPPNPRKSPILIGRLMKNSVYYLNTVQDGKMNPTGVDEEIWGPEYPYPGGLAYLISSSLVTILLSPSPPLPHHIHYPSDDVMIGAWIAGLRAFPSAAASPLEIKSPAPPVPPALPKSFSPPKSPSLPTKPKPAVSPTPPNHLISSFSSTSFSAPPTPYLPHSINTTVLNDPGLHDYPGRGGNDAVVSWGSVCVHRMSVQEMKRVRGMEGIEREWV